MLNTQNLQSTAHLNSALSNSAMCPNATTLETHIFDICVKAQDEVRFRRVELLQQIKTHIVSTPSKLMKSNGTHSWVSLGSWKALTGIWLMRFLLNLRTCRVAPRWSRAPSSNTLILLLLRYLNTKTAYCDFQRFLKKTLKHKLMNGSVSAFLYNIVHTS